MYLFIYESTEEISIEKWMSIIERNDFYFPHCTQQWTSGSEEIP